MKCPTIGEVGKIVYRSSAFFTSWGLHRASEVASTVAICAAGRALCEEILPGFSQFSVGPATDVYFAGKSVQEHAESLHPEITSGVVALVAAAGAMIARSAAQKIDASLSQKQVVNATKIKTV